MFAKHRARKFIAAGDRARDRRDWAAAAGAYSAALSSDPGNAAIWVQHGHALKENGDLEGAERSYRKALSADPSKADSHLQLGHVAKLLGKPGDALAAYVEAARLDPSLQAARDELELLGAIDAIAGVDGGETRARELLDLRTSLDRTLAKLGAWADKAPVAAQDFDLFRRSFQISPPPSVAPQKLLVFVDATEAAPAMVRRTALSLLDQVHADWSAMLAGPATLDEHPVGSLARIEPRLRLIQGLAIPEDVDDKLLTIVLQAGTVLDPQALSWFSFASCHTGATRLFADHDAVLPDWKDGPSHYAPRLYGAFDRDFFEGVEEPPLVVACLAGALKSKALADVTGHELRRAILLAGEDDAPPAHVARILASRAAVPQSVLGGVNDLPCATPRAAAALSRPSVPDECGHLTVIIPTRDEAQALEECVESLLAKARQPRRLDICIVNNRSTERETAALFSRWAARDGLRVLQFDEPFNWSRVNNFAVSAASTAKRLLFLNNDTKMLTDGWDEALHGLLDRPEVGAVGAKLLYPDSTVQHGGILFGLGRGSPVHEAVGAAAIDPGPLGRWSQRRAVPATTGAFLACQRSHYESVGGFDEIGLPIAFNDVDFCLKLRSAGLLIVYEPAIQLVHYESKTRGQNDTASKLLWDSSELEILAARWGEALFYDPGYNPQWAQGDTPFVAYREPAASLILQHLERSARPQPWALPLRT